MPPVPALPSGSAITLRDEGAQTVIEIPQQKRGASSYFQGLFLLAWLGGWAFGFVTVSSQLLAGKGNLFSMFWLAAWTVGGGFAMYAVYRTFRPSVPERLMLQTNGATYDSGIAPLQSGFGQSRKDGWKSLTARRKKLELDRTVLRSLQLRPTDSSNRLTVDVGAERIDLAASASEIEREWLYQVLAKKYGLSSRHDDSRASA